VIAAQQELLDDVAGDQWWDDVTLPMLELVRRRVRGLVKLIEKARQVVVYTDLEDELGEATEVAFRGVTVAADFERFRAKAQAYLRAHEDHLALHEGATQRAAVPGGRRGARPDADRGWDRGALRDRRRAR